MPIEDLDFFHIARRQFDRAIPFVHPLEGWRGMAEMLFEPERVIKVALPVVLDDGYVHNFSGYRVLHDNAQLLSLFPLVMPSNMIMSLVGD